MQEFIFLQAQWPSSKQVWHLITCYHLCVGSISHPPRPQVANSQVCANMTLAVECDEKHQLRLGLYALQ